MNPKKHPIQWVILGTLVLIAALSRLLPHPPNFTAVGAVALFGSAYFSRRWMAFLIPLLALWLSDLVLNNVIYAPYYDHFVLFTAGFEWLYGSFVLIIILGAVWLKKVNVQNLLGASITASTLFFLISNFGIWKTGLMYPQTWEGLMACYTSAIPFYWTTLAGDLFYVTIVFGAYALLSQRYPQLKFSQLEIK